MRTARLILVALGLISCGQRTPASHGGQTADSPVASPAPSPAIGPSSTPAATPVSLPASSQPKCPASGASATASSGPPAPASTADEPLPSSVAVNASAPANAPLEQAIVAKMLTSHLPGLAAVVVHGHQVVWSGAFGSANLHAHRPATLDTLWSIGSVTKLFTGLAVMQMVEAGKLSLDADVDSVLPYRVRHPSYPDVAITPRMLLAHVASLPHNLPQDVFDAMENDGSYETMEIAQALPRWLVPGQPLYRTTNFDAAKPGTTYEYSNLGLTLAGGVLEAVSGETWEHYLSLHIFAPLCMTNSYARLADYQGGDLATAYALNDAKTALTPFPDFVFPEYPSGEMITSVTQMASFLMALGDGGGPLVSRQTFASMLQAQFPQSQAPDEVQGLVFYADHVGAASSDLMWGHSGAADGTTAYLQFRPSDGFGFFLVTNSDSPVAFDPLLELGDRLHDEFGGS